MTPTFSAAGHRALVQLIASADCRRFAESETDGVKNAVFVTQYHIIPSHQWEAITRAAELEQSQSAQGDFIDIVFDGPPGPNPGRFVEVENSKGASIRFGEWVHREDGRWVLRIQSAPTTTPVLDDDGNPTGYYREPDGSVVTLADEYDAADDCETCGGRGVVGGPTGQTPEQFEYRTEPCPDCQPTATPGAQGAGQADG